MEINILIILGIILLILAVFFAMPFFGIGMVLPYLGDVIDIPLAFFMAVAGVILLAVGGVFQMIVTYWWVFALFFAVLIVFNAVKVRFKVIT